MSAELIDGTAIARQVRKDVTKRVAELVADGGTAPGLATVLIGDDPASEVYVRNKLRACTAAGMTDLYRHLPGDTDQATAAALLDALADDPAVSGILLQLPLPTQLNADSLLARIPSDKDVDGLTTDNAGLLAQGKPGLRPCTPTGVMVLLDRYAVPLEGSEAVVVGRSVLVGKPMAQLLLERNATVTVCHSRTRDLVEVCRRADVLVVAAGIPGLIGPDAVQPGATVIDIGIHREENGLRGDVDTAAVAEVAARVTPVPGGVGPMTIAMLLANTLTAARRQQGPGRTRMSGVWARFDDLRNALALRCPAPRRVLVAKRPGEVAGALQEPTRRPGEPAGPSATCPTRRRPASTTLACGRSPGEDREVRTLSQLRARGGMEQGRAGVPRGGRRLVFIGKSAPTHPRNPRRAFSLRSRLRM